jgi:hypothetical protein
VADIIPSAPKHTTKPLPQPCSLLKAPPCLKFRVSDPVVRSVVEQHGRLQQQRASSLADSAVQDLLAPSSSVHRPVCSFEWSEHCLVGTLWNIGGCLRVSCPCCCASLHMLGSLGATSEIERVLPLTTMSSSHWNFCRSRVLAECIRNMTDQPLAADGSLQGCFCAWRRAPPRLSMSCMSFQGSSCATIRLGPDESGWLKSDLTT